VGHEVITVRERSTQAITRQQTAGLEAIPAFWQLVDDGILSMERRRAASSLTAACYVGQAVLGKYVVQITEKVPGSLGSLLLFAERPDARLSEAESFVQESDLLLLALVDRFLEMVERYLVFGRRKVYVVSRARRSMPAGKITVPETMRLWAKGRRDQVIFDRSDLSPGVFLNRIVGLALCVVDGILAGSPADRRRRERVRTNSMFFEDVGWQSLLRLPLRELDRLCRLNLREQGALASLGSLARLLALHFGTKSLSFGETSPFSWFVNLESLFEECFRKAMRIVASEFGVSVSDAAVAEQYVFPEQRTYRAEPDVVISRAGTRMAVADTKHKDFGGTPSNPDIYQLVAHAKAWGVSTAALVYPSQSITETSIGTAATGVAIKAFTVNVADLIRGARAVMSSLVPAGTVSRGMAALDA